MNLVQYLKRRCSALDETIFISSHPSHPHFPTLPMVDFLLNLVDDNDQLLSLSEPICLSGNFGVRADPEWGIRRQP